MMQRSKWPKVCHILFCFCILDEDSGLNAVAYSNVNYDYYGEAGEIDDGDKEYDPSDCFVDANQGWLINY